MILGVNKFGSVAFSMLSVAYGRQMPANGGKIDNLGLPAPDCCDVPILMCSESASSSLFEATIIEIESDPNFRAE